MPTEIVIIGAGGHARVVLNAAQLQFPNSTITIRDDNPALQGKNLDGAIITTPIMPLGERIYYHVAIGNNSIRKKLLQLLHEQTKSLSLLTIIHPTTTIASSSQINLGCFIAAHAIVAPGAKINEGCIINHGAIIDHDCTIGAWSHIAPNATLGGNVKVGKGCLVGSGAVILPGIQIADFVTVGSGAVVTKNIEIGATVIGVPAKTQSHTDTIN